MAHKYPFPFAAVVGQGQAKRALLIALVNPKVGGVLIAGEKGAAKSTLVRGLTDLLSGVSLVELPLNATEDMVYGSVDMEYAVKHGQWRFSPGILAKAHGNVLYIDEINLLRRDLVNAIVDTAAAGVNVVERDGISHQHPAAYTIVGTMNPEEGTFSAPLLDRFGLYAFVNREQDAAQRVEIVCRHLAYEKEPEYFRRLHGEMTNTLVQQVTYAKTLLSHIEVAEAMIHLAAQLCAQARSAGHRAELFLLEAAKAIAALAGREYLLPGDLDEAALYVLPHRMRQEEQPPLPEQQEQPEETPTEEPQSSPPDGPQDNSDSQQPPTGEDGQGQQEDPPEGQQEQQAPSTGTDKEQTADIDKSFPLMQMVMSQPQDRQVRQGSGKRSLTRTDTKQGRYVRSGIPKGKLTDLAFDATLRAAAPYQQGRSNQHCCMTILQEDLRQKVREKRIGSTFLFVVDASGSMGARQRMRAVKGAIFAMLLEAYQKRDQVGLIAFRRQTAEVLLPITRSVDLAKKCLQHLPTGGKTPLAEGLYAGLSVLQSMHKKEREMLPVLVLVTDGRANSGPDSGSDPVADTFKVAGKIRDAGFSSVVIDTDTDFVRVGIAQAVAQKMGATYYRLDDLSDQNIVRIVKNLQ